jgi:two-component system, sensor histidine kinase and response regulator
MVTDCKSLSDIIIVDDTPGSLRLLEEILSEGGYQVRAFPRGDQALAAAAEQPPGLIMLDINMPDLNGFQVCERLKANMQLSAIPVIFISALSDPLDKLNAFRCGGVDYVTKPFHGSEVLARVATHRNLRRLQRELELHNERLEHLVRQRTRELAAAKGRLAILDKAKSDFLMLISHELRTPLTGLFGVTDLVFMEGESVPAVARFRASYDESRQRLLKMLEDALVLSQIEVEGKDYALQPTSLSFVLADALARASEFAKTRNVQLGSPPAFTAPVLGKEELLARALRSLIETAVVFCPGGAAVEFSGDVTPTETHLEIATNGRQIPSQALARFFDVFSIGEPVAPGGDLGLGPPMAERILALFGGTVTAKNVDPPGVRLRVTLRLAGARAAQDCSLPPF